MIAVHCGAGSYSEKNRKKYRQLLKRAAKVGLDALKNGGEAMEAVKMAIEILENSPLTNAGFGSNLTARGRVEMDASIMNGKTLLYGACAAIENVKNPIQLAYCLNTCQLTAPLPMGLVNPTFLVGRGGDTFAREHNLKLIANRSELVSTKALRQNLKYRKLLDDLDLVVNKNNEDDDSVAMDTVGAVCLDQFGNTASGCSSGGVLLKCPGRVGQAAQFGAGAWAESDTTTTKIAICTTGCGEQLTQTLLAKTCADELLKDESTTTTTTTIFETLHETLRSKFVESRFLRHMRPKPKLFGVVGLKKLLVAPSNDIEEVALFYGHSTRHLGVGYMKLGDKMAKALISELPAAATEGDSVNVSGSIFDCSQLINEAQRSPK